MSDADKAIVLAQRIQKMADDHMEKITRDFDVMKMPHQFRAIVYGAISRKAMELTLDSEAQS